MKLHRLFALVGVLAMHIFPEVSKAAPDVLPGLWETDVEVSSKSGQYEQAMAQAQEMLATMPPEQQQMMKEMMGRRGTMFDLTDRTMQICLTQEAIERFDIAQTTDGCTQSFEETSQNHFVIALQCDEQGMSGNGEFVVNNNKSYTGTMVMDINVNGQPDTITMKQDARWLSADCGDVQPN